MEKAPSAIACFNSEGELYLSGRSKGASFSCVSARCKRSRVRTNGASGSLQGHVYTCSAGFVSSVSLGHGQLCTGMTSYFEMITNTFGNNIFW